MEEHPARDPTDEEEGRQPSDGERQTPRPCKRFRTFEQKAAVAQRANNQTLQVLCRLRLHARGDFFGEQLEEKV